MTCTNPQSRAAVAIVALAVIKSEAEAFDRGESNAFDALDAIIAAVEDYQATARIRREAA